jgi:hypothetical protein
LILPAREIYAKKIAPKYKEFFKRFVVDPAIRLSSKQKGASFIILFSV